MNKPEADLVQMHIFIKIFRFYFDKLTFAKWYLTWPLEIVRQKTVKLSDFKKISNPKVLFESFWHFYVIGRSRIRIKNLKNEYGTCSIKIREIQSDSRGMQLTLIL